MTILDTSTDATDLAARRDPLVSARTASSITGAATAVTGILLGRLLVSMALAGLLSVAVAAACLLVFRRFGIRPGPLVVGAVVGLAVALPVLSPDVISIDNATMIAALSIIAVSQYVITGLSGQMSIGQGAIAAVGAYGFAVAVDHDVPWPLALPLGALAAAVAGLVIGLVALRLKDLYLAMVTLGLVVALPSIVKTDWLAGLTGGADGLILDPPTLLFEDRLGTAALYLTVLVIAALVAAIVAAVARSRHGLSMRALEFSEVAARSSGVPLFRYRMASFLLASLVAGLGGAVYVMVLGITTPSSFSVEFSLLFLMMIVIGGQRRLAGAFVGAAIVWWLRINLEGITLPLGSREVDLLPGVVFGAAVALVVLFLPGGVTAWVANAVGTLGDRLRARRLGHADRTTGP